MDTCETVMITGKNGPVRINKSDFDAKTMTEYSPSKSEKSAVEQATQLQPEAGNVQIPANPDFPPQPAPSAPEFVDPVAPTAPSPNQRFVKAEGKGKSERHYIVDGTGARLEIDGVDPKGYATEQEAWAAIMALPH